MIHLSTTIVIFSGTTSPLYSIVLRQHCQTLSLSLSLSLLT